jgi:hypothetical protein
VKSRRASLPQQIREALEKSAPGALPPPVSLMNGGLVNLADLVVYFHAHPMAYG